MPINVVSVNSAGKASHFIQADSATAVSKMPKMRTLLVVCALVGASCAARTTTARVSPVELARAQTLAAAGCYSCLVDALAIYEKAGARRAAFETALFVVLRDKELGIPEDAALAKARTLAAALGPDAVLLAELADLTQGEPTGQDPDKSALR